MHIYISDNVGICNRIDNPWLRDRKFSFFSLHREKEKKKIYKLQPEPEPQGYGLIPRWFMERIKGVLLGWGHSVMREWGDSSASIY